MFQKGGPQGRRPGWLSGECGAAEREGRESLEAWGLRGGVGCGGAGDGHLGSECSGQKGQGWGWVWGVPRVPPGLTS